MRTLAAVTAAVLAFAGLLNWQSIALIVACVALAVAVVALYRSGIRDNEVAAWKEDQLARAKEQGSALSDDLRED